MRCELVRQKPDRQGRIQDSRFKIQDIETRNSKLETLYELVAPRNGVAIPELDSDTVNEADKTELAFDAQLLLSEGRHASGLKLFTAAPAQCLISDVELFSRDANRRLLIRGEGIDVAVETSLEEGQVTIQTRPA